MYETPMTISLNESDFLAILDLQNKAAGIRELLPHYQNALMRSILKSNLSRLEAEIDDWWIRFHRKYAVPKEATGDWMVDLEHHLVRRVG